MKAARKLNVEVTRRRFLQTIDAVQYDTGVQIVLTVKDLTIPSGTTARVFFKKPSGKFVYQDAVVSGNVVTIDVHNQALTEYGNVTYQVRLANGADIVTTFSGKIEVQPSLADSSATTSETVVPAFDAAVQSAVTEIESARDGAIAYIGQGLDDTLSVEGKAADAKATGAAVAELKGDLVQMNKVVNPNIVEGKYVHSDTGLISVHSAYNYLLIPVSEGDVFKYSAGANENVTGVAFYISDTLSVSTYISGELGTSAIKKVTVPANAKYAVFTYRVERIEVENVITFLGNVYNFRTEINSIQTEINSIQTEIYDIKPANFKSQLELKDLSSGFSIIHEKRIANYDPTTRELEILDYAGGYLYKVNLSILKSGILTGAPYTPTYNGTARAFTIATGENDNINVVFSAKWGAITSIDNWLTVNDSGEWILDISAIISKYAGFSYGSPKYLYIWSEYSDEIIINFNGEAILPSWLSFPTTTDVMEIATDVFHNIISMPSLVLPTDSVSVVGHEYNIYYDNVIDGYSDQYDVTVSILPSITNTYLYSDTIRIIPTISDVGDHTMTISVLNRITREAAAAKTMTLHVIADTAVSNKKVIFIGDSLTNAGVYPAEIQHNLSNGGITSLGTRSNTVTIAGISLDVNHEGRSGWSSYDYVNKETYANMVNAFWDGSTFNFSHYMNQQEYDSVDVVCIGLGTNGGNSQLMYDALTKMVESIRTYSSDIKILVALTCPPASQDGCGKNNHTQSSATLKHNFLNVVRRYLDNYQNTNDKNLDIVELYFHLDTKNDFNTVTEEASARNPIQVVRQNNNVHPSTYGYLHFADAYYNRILYHLTK